MFVESRPRPHAVGTPRPRFSWAVPANGQARGRRQSAYRLLVATTPEQLDNDQPDLWDTGRVESNQSTHVEYAGPPLKSNTDYWWTVRLWDENGQALPGGRVETFSTALLDASEWTAQWIGLCDPDEPFPDPTCFQIGPVPPEIEAFEHDPRAPMLCREFDLDQPVRRARVFACGVGLHELRVNGSKVGHDVLSTPRTDFRKRLLYNTYDVTEQLRQGPNAVGLILGNGWFNGQKKYWGWQHQWHGSPRGIAQLHIELADGSTRQIVTDDAWQGTWSPITANCLFDGEAYDARLEQPGWDTPGHDRADWQTANAVPAPGGRLDAINCDPQRITDTIRPVGKTEPEPGTHVFDLGKNMTGWARLRIHHATPGQTITLRFGEAVHADGSLNNSSQNAALQTDQYTCKGGPLEVWEPRFTFHGFQYVEVTGAPDGLRLDSIDGRFVRMDVPETGTFACGNDLINHIHACTVQSQRCNLQMGVPTDDTQRPERQGWGGDAWAMANQTFYNFAAQGVFTKWLGDYRDQQSPNGRVGMITPQAGSEEDLVWSAAFPLITWWHYLYTGDRRVLEENRPALQRYFDFLKKCGRNHVPACAQLTANQHVMPTLSEDERFPTDDDKGHLQVTQWGDHLATTEGHAARANLPRSIATAFYYLDAITMANITDALGDAEQAEQYRGLAEQINQQFHDYFYNDQLHEYDTGVQSAQAWPIAFGMVREAQREPVEQRFARNVGQTQRRLTTGYAGTRYAVRALARIGRNDIVWQLANKTDYPSWGYMLSHGRTTACERWCGTAGSLNHVPLCAAIDEWFYADLAGIQPDPDRPGYAHTTFKPYLPPDLPWAQASLQTMRGPIRSAWTQAHGQATLTLTVPPNTTATAHIPCADLSNIKENNTPATQADGITGHEEHENQTLFHLTAGTYRFTFPIDNH